MLLATELNYLFSTSTRVLFASGIEDSLILRYDVEVLSATCIDQLAQLKTKKTR
jgi:hypothetical protein